ncbi:iron-sulfur cluster assembly accessory protein [Exilibacterium tricleocarpae]|uniref:Iron-sulfur cluster assembly accessory protein n=1 Tax=Exilibacterium tricleocarpae TaxID=2591008 RepID=A0A545U6N9_9GAMM|nr:iron-sulfur cluster assembly accessory protein [Exilibacterium tricleocarpae]TQV85136.1 iron-sulfur cluster assembly accessory protein [Exilibacterium tricleocarpae]
MTVEKFENRDLVTVTPAAAAYFRQQLDKDGGRVVRIGVKQSGCTGFMYVLDQVDAAAGSDIEIPLDNGVVVAVDPAAIPVLGGSNIDYVLEGINKVIKIDNPNATSACGCGESFAINE